MSEKCASSSEWEDVSLSLPKGYIHPNVPDIDEYISTHFKETYEDGKPKFKVYYRRGWHVEKICPCGLTSCEKHVIPSETSYTGSVSGLASKFMRKDVMTTDEAKQWWGKHGGKTTVRPGFIHRCLMVPYPYTFPKGHELKGLVDETKADEVVHQHFKDNYKIVGNNVVQVCPCGKTECNLHIIPSTVNIKASFPLEMHLHTRKRGSKGKRKKVPPILFGEEFRKEQPMSLADAREWFLSVGLKFAVDVQPGQITLQMICKCGKPFEKTPCKACYDSEFNACQECGDKYRKRMLKKYEGKRICGNCRRKKVALCDVCKKMARLDHTCLPLLNQHHSGRINSVYPPIMRQHNQEDGICPDCKKGVNNKVYHRHQYRRHSDLKACHRYTRAYQVHFCHYCDYTNCDITNVREHEKFHYMEKLHKCQFCDLRFARASSRAIHHRVAHREFSGHRAFQVTRRGDTVVRERRLGTIQYLA